jgi:hypothetical protein
VEWLPDPKLHLLGQCHLWLLCLIFQVATLLSLAAKGSSIEEGTGKATCQ